MVSVPSVAVIYRKRKLEMAASKSKQTTSDTSSPASAAAENQDQLPAWEEVEAGRYRPRRIRGSCRGRELG